MSIVIEHLNYIYSENTAYQRQALKDINLEIPEGQFIGLIGHTGSGKSTLTQHLNGLLKASSGVIRFNGENIYAVSYTHLDVYKRQSSGRLYKARRPDEALGNRPGDSGMQGHYP